MCQPLLRPDNGGMDMRWKPSVTVAAVIEREGRYLLIEEHTPEGLRLNNPAGHLDPGESLVQGCEREAFEAFSYTKLRAYDTKANVVCSPSIQ